MQRIRNRAIVVCAGIVFCCVALNFAAQAAIPGYTVPESSAFEGKAYQHFEAPTVQTLAEGSFQTGFESFLADHIPARDDVVAANATLQLTSIRAANAFTAFPCYPSYYGSNRLYIPAVDAVSYLPSKQSDDIDESIRQFAVDLADFAVRYPDKRFAVYLVGACSAPDVNPAYELVTDSVDNDHFAAILADGSATAENVRVFTCSYDSLESYYQANWRTDHHWNAIGAALACNRMADFLGWEPYADLTLTEVYENGFMGRLATVGLCPITEPAVDLDRDFSALTLTELGTGKRYSGNDHFTFWNLSEDDRRLQFNAEWYRSTETSRIEGTGVGNAVLVTDSFGSGIQMLVAEHYATTEVPWALYAENSGSDLLADSLDDSVEDVIFVADFQNYATFAARYPLYFQ